MLNSHAHSTESACRGDRILSSQNIPVSLLHSMQDKNFLNKRGKITYQGFKDITENVNT